MYFDTFKRKYISIQEARGGGIWQASFNNNPLVNEIMQKMKSYFFVGGNPFYGKEEEMEFMLGNFKGEKIISKNFKLVNYILQKSSRKRICICCPPSLPPLNKKEKEEEQ